MTINDVYLNDVIEKKYSTKFRETNFEMTYTNTSLFVLPMLGIPIIKLGLFFVNCFLKDKEYTTELERPLFLMFKFDYTTKDQERNCKAIHEELIHKEEFITYYYTGNFENSKCIMYLFNLKEEFDHDYKMFMEGKYSKFRPEFKARFPKTIIESGTGRQVKTIMGQVIEKSPDLRKYWNERLGITLDEESEVWTKPYLEEVESI